MTSLKKISRWLTYLLLILLIIFVLAMLAVRFIVFPNIDSYKNDIAAYATKTAGQKITLGNIYSSWDGFSPHIALFNVDLYDAQNRPALKLNNVEVTLSWLSLPLLRPHLASLLVNSPELTIRRQPDGNIYLAGISLAGESKPDFTNWLLHQSKLNIKNAQVIWQDDLRQAPPLSLNQLNLTLSNPTWQSLYGQHSLVLSALPSVGTKQPITATGRFVGRDVTQINKWQGSFSAELKQADLSVWKPWFDYSVLNQTVDVQSGTGDAQITVDFSGAKVEKVSTHANITKLALLTGTQSVPFSANSFSGDIGWSDFKNTQTISADNIKLSADNGLNISKGRGYFARSTKNGKPWIKADIKLDQFNLNSVQQLTPYFTLPENANNQLNSFAPTGELEGLALGLEGDATKPSLYQLKASFKKLGINAAQKMPGFSNLSGTIHANQNGGEVILNTLNAKLDFKDVLRWPIPADKLSGVISWQINHNNTNHENAGDQATIKAKELFISNAHIAGTLNASYALNTSKGGHLDLSGKFGKGNAKFAPFYYPLVLGKPTLHWLDTSILAGKAEDINITVKGNLADFPFVNSKNQLDQKLGLFRVSAKISDALLEYGTGWPAIEGLGLDMLFEGKHMQLNANKGHIFGNKIISSKTDIAQLDADSPILNITSEVEGTTVDGIKFVNESPVKLVTQGFTDALKTAGNGKLSLDLSIPMQHLEGAKYKGAYLIKNGTIFANTEVGLPELSKINGVLNFTETSLSAQNINTEIAGNPAQISLKTGADKVLHINANGHINDANLKKLSSNALVDSMQGSTDWTGEITIKKPLVELTMRSTMLGMAINLPAPFSKPANKEIAFSVDKKQISADNDTININYGDTISAKLIRSLQAGKLLFERGDIGVNIPAIVPTHAGLSVHGKLDYLAADDWLALFNKPNNAARNSTPMLINKAELAIQKLDVYGRSLNALTVSTQPSATGLKMAINSQEITGDAEWQNAGNGKIIARLKSLTIPSNNDKGVGSDKKVESKQDFRKQSREYPALDVIAENFQIGNKKLGVLELNAFESGDDWIIQKLKIANPDSTLMAEGSWHNWTRSPNTNMKFLLNVNNIGNTLKRFGQPDAVKGGDTEITGQLEWAGSPHEFDAISLNGNIKLDANKGQFLKVDPSVGRLLGLLSLQSLPRRLSLDFRDLFSDGFAFDKITATATIDRGILRSNDFFMTGPAAEAKIKGETNLKNETQNLKIKVRPHVSDSLSLAAFAGGPIAGVAAFVAQKILKDPFNKIVQSEYVIAGTWDKPVEVESNKEDAQKPIANSPLK